METTHLLLTLVLAVNGLQLFILRDLSGRVRHLERREMDKPRAGRPMFSPEVD